MKKKLFSFSITFTFVFLHIHNSFSQIGAEAQGGKMTLWAAVGLDQELSERWLSVTDFGYGRHSDPDNYSFTKRLGLNVLTQDFVYKANAHWHFVFSAGYWRRNFYSDDIPYDARPAPYSYRNELRPFQRIIYTHNVNSIKVSHALRSDFRFYYNQYFNDQWTTPFEFRLRYMETWKFPLTKNKKNWFIAVDEILSAVDRSSAGVSKRWSPYQITENRFSLYYRRSINAQKISIDIGIMHQYWCDKPGISNFNTSYNLMADIIFRDLFRKKKKEKEAGAN